MSQEKIVGLIEELPTAQLELLREVLPVPWRLEPDGNSALTHAEAIIIRDGVLDSQMLEQARELRTVVRIDVGRGSIDEDACHNRGIAIDRIPSPSLMSVAEHAVMAMLMLLKRYKDASARLRAGVVVDGVEPELTTQEKYAFNWVGLEQFDALWGQTVGLVGLGRIGTHAARLLRAFGAEVLCTKRTPLTAEEEGRLGVRCVTLDELLRRSRIVSLHNRFTPETEKMMGAREFALMPERSFFVNTARGRLVDEAALVEALNSDHLAGAALDVFWYEPLPPKSPLVDAANLILTPHTGGIPSAESQALELREAARRLTP